MKGSRILSILLSFRSVQLIVGCVLCLGLFVGNTWLLTRRFLMLRWEKMDR